MNILIKNCLIIDTNSNHNKKAKRYSNYKRKV